MSGQSDNYPFEIKPVSKEDTEEFLTHYGESLQEGFVRIGPKRYFFPNGFIEEAPKYYNMKVRPDDTWVVTFPKCGTTWTQELVWMVGNNFDYEKAAAKPLVARIPFLEMSMIMNCPKGKKMFEDMKKEHPDKLHVIDVLSKPGWQEIEKVPSPRFIKSHLPLTLLPPDLVEKNKVVYVARDPRDVAVSFYHHSAFFTSAGYTGDFKAFWSLFIRDMIEWAPFFEHVKEAWKLRNDPNMLFLFYEDLLSDLPGSVKKVAKFLGKTVTEEQLTKVCDHLVFKNFKKNPSVNFEFGKQLGMFRDVKKSFIRNGKAGNWRDYFDEEMTKQADEWIAKNLAGTDLTFPSMIKE